MVLDERRNVVYIFTCDIGGVEIRDRSLNTRLDFVGTYCGSSPGPTMAMDAAAERLYVNNGDGGGLDVIDLSVRQYTDSFHYPFNGDTQIALNVSTGFVYQPGYGFDLAVLDPSKAAGDPQRFMTVPIQWDRSLVHASIAVNPNTNLVYASSVCGGSPFHEELGVAVVDGTPGSPTFHTVVASPRYPVEPLPPPPQGWNRCGTAVAVNRRTNMVYVAARDTLHMIDGNPVSPAFNTFVAHIPFPEGSKSAWSLAVNPVTNRVYVSSWNQTGPPSLVTVDEASLSVISSTDLPGQVYGWVMVDAAANRVVVNDRGGLLPASTTILSDLVTQSSVVPADEGVPVTVGTAAATITFSEVASAGSVTLEPIDASELPLALPGQFSIDGGLTYDVSTTATIGGPITICFNVSYVVDPTLFATLRVLHGEGGSWVDRTVSRDYAAGTICAITESLSPFVVGHLDVRYSVRTLYDQTRAVRAGATFPLKIQLLAPTGENMSAPDISVTAIALRKTSNAVTSAVQDTGNANPDGNFRFEASLDGGGYIFNLRTTGLSSGTYELEFVGLGDPTRHTLIFQVR
jgi:hypothetical protein